MKNDENKVARGVYAAVLTPFSDRLEPDTLKFVEHCRWLLENGCDGLAPFGTTGEGASLSAGQKIELLKAAKDAGLPMDRMIVGAGSCALEDAVAVGRAATLYGCEGVLFLPPFLDKPDVRDFIGLPFQRPDLSTSVRPLVPGVFGLNFFSAIFNYIPAFISIDWPSSNVTNAFL